MTRPALSGPAIVVEDVTKAFAVPHERVHTFKERALHPLRRSGADRFEALKHTSFAVEHGEFFGIVGRNGSGKSTLLKCLAGIYGVSGGRISRRGRMSTFIELGVGFNPDLAARDNVVLNAIMLGLSRKEAEARYQRILDFAELGEFEELKIKNYSSGMLVRLAFSVMIQVDADILLIDEVLAVGDASFQQKCFDEFNRLRDERRTILFVTHDMGAVSKYCDRAMLLEKGATVMIDEPGPVASEYFELNFGRGQGLEPAVQDSGQAGDGRATLLDGWFEDSDGQRTEALHQGSACRFRAVARFNEAVEDPALGVSFEDAEDRTVFATSTIWDGDRTGSFAAGEHVTLTVAFDVSFTPGRYFANPAVAPRAGAGDVLDRRRHFATLLVTGARASGGMVDLEHEVRLERAGRPAAPEPTA